MSNKRRWTNEQLIESAKRSDSLSELIRNLGLSAKAPGNRQTVKKYIKELDVDISHLVGQSWVGTRKHKPELLRIDSADEARCPLCSRPWRKAER